uniref:Ig-like domain-containing protein n=1 Tax=Kryptolebias marmoratus TaxID=37003 RepID=A0A3Q3G276_KRYMA
RTLLCTSTEYTLHRGATLQCDVSGFYPKKLAVTWHIQNDSHTVHPGMSHHSRVCTELAVLNPDGTYSIRSSITLHSNIVTNTEILVICQVEHQTFNHLFNRSGWPDGGHC